MSLSHLQGFVSLVNRKYLLITSRRPVHAAASVASFQALTSIHGAAAAQEFTVSTPPDRTEIDTSVMLINARLGAAVNKGQEIQVLFRIRSLFHVTMTNQTFLTCQTYFNSYTPDL